jgi:hypothetical protein
MSLFETDRNFHPTHPLAFSCQPRQGGLDIVRLCDLPLGPMQARACRSDHGPGNHAGDAALKQTLCFSPKRAVRGRAAKKRARGSHLSTVDVLRNISCILPRPAALTAKYIKQVSQSPSSTRKLSKNKMGMDDASHQASGGSHRVTTERVLGVERSQLQ